MALRLACSLRKSRSIYAKRQIRLLSCSASRWTSDDDERYIQVSKVPTMHFQPSLPRLPIPKLEDTCRRYLAAVRPLVGDEEYEKTEALVKEFGREGGDGSEIHRRLKLFDSENKHTSYISEPWFDMYLRSRLPLPLNYNPFMAFLEDPRTTDQADRATNFIRSAVRFRSSLRDNKLEPEVYHLNPAKSDTQWFRNIIRFIPSTFSWYGAFLVKAFPLDMSQYNRLFNSTRIPCEDKDELVSYEPRNHVVVIRNGHFYTLDAAQPNGLPTPSSTVHSQLKWILSDPHPPPSHYLGYLTSLERNQWARVRKELMKSEQNRQALEAIDSAMFVLCLDDKEATEPVGATHTFLHNYGYNRWFDKPFSLMVAKEGVSALNFEHAWGDGVAVLRLFTEVFKDTVQKPYIPREGVEASSEGVKNLEFQLSEEVKSAIETARSTMEENGRSLSVDVLEYELYGKEFIKKTKLSPDAVIQLAFQIAYYRQYKCCVPTYESCSTAAFRHGRTETIRPASIASKACAEAFEQDSSASLEEKGKFVKEMSAWHSRLTKEAAMGQGCDRHMFALKTIAEREWQGTTLPIFEDPTYSHVNQYILSTSTLSSDIVLLGAFAPVVSNGYGIGYNVLDNRMGCNVTTYPTRDGAEFVKNVEQALHDIHAVIGREGF